MATSQNSWPVFTNANGLENFPWVTGRLRPKDVIQIFEILADWFNENIESIRKDHSWAYAYRPVRGSQDTYSNHASATAVDFNAPKHPLGVKNTFTPGQAQKIRTFLRDELDDAIRWGGDYRRRPDEMHFEIDCDQAELSRVLKNYGKKHEPQMPPERKPTVASCWVDLRYLSGKTQSRAKRSALVFARKTIEPAVDLNKVMKMEPVGVPTMLRVTSDLTRMHAESKSEATKTRLWRARTITRRYALPAKGKNHPKHTSATTMEGA